MSCVRFLAVTPPTTGAGSVRRVRSRDCRFRTPILGWCTRVRFCRRGGADGQSAESTVAHRVRSFSHLLGIR